MTVRVLSVESEEATEAEWVQQGEPEGTTLGQESAVVNNVNLRTLDAPHQRSGPEG